MFQYSWEIVFYSIVVMLLIGGLIIYTIFLWGNKTRGKRIENRGLILFSDDPYEEIKPKTKKNKKV